MGREVAETGERFPAPRFGDHHEVVSGVLRRDREVTLLDCGDVAGGWQR